MHGNKEGESRRYLLQGDEGRERLLLDPEPRLARMDQLGIDKAIMWPTAAGLR